MPSYPNQKRLKIYSAPHDEQHQFSIVNRRANEYALKTLSYPAYKIYMYIKLNQDGFILNLSPKDILDNIGIPKITTHKAIKELIDNKFIIEGKNINNYIFNECPSDKLYLLEESDEDDENF